MPIQLLKSMSKLGKFYNKSSSIDPENTAIILIKESFYDAIMYYSGNSKKIQTLPTFIILDITPGLTEDIALADLIKKFKINIIPAHRKDQIPQKNFCLYTKPEVHREIQINKIQAILSAYMAYFNIKDSVCIDISVFDQLYTPPMRTDFVDSRMEDIVKIYKALANDSSREQFLRIIKFLKTGDTCYLMPVAYAQYEHPKVKAEEGDYIIEGGLDTGATTLRFLEKIGPNGHIYAFEPLQNAYSLTKTLTAQYSNATIEHLGLYSKSTKFYVENLGCSSYLVEAPTANTEECYAITIDYYMENKTNRCDMIKLDIEGAEIECLIGAEKTISKFYPKLQISLYHLPPNQYLDIPLMILEKYPDYQLYIGHHGIWLWESMLYAIKK